VQSKSIFILQSLQSQDNKNFSREILTTSMLCRLPIKPGLSDLEGKIAQPGLKYDYTGWINSCYIFPRNKATQSYAFGESDSLFTLPDRSIWVLTIISMCPLALSVPRAACLTTVRVCKVLNQLMKKTLHLYHD
jgi:hypothetical protein